MKSHICLVLLLALLTIAFGIPALGETFSKDGFTYEYMRDGNLRLIKYENKQERGTVYIPDTIDGHHVECIGEYAFDGCKMSKVTIPETVWEIETFAFNDCKEIQKITIPNGVYHIDGNPFTGCTKLTNISVDMNHETLRITSDGVLYSKMNKMILCYPCTKTNTEYTVYENTLKIGRNAFAGCETLKKIILPETVTEIGSEAFFGCKNLSAIRLPESLLSMDEMVFAGCFSLSNIVIPSKVSRIEKSAFFNCTKLSSVKLPENLTVINDRAFFGCKSLEKVNLPFNVNTVGEQAFYGCKNLSHVKIPPTTTKIGAAAFDDCSVNLHVQMDEHSYAWIYAKINDLS